MDWNFRNDQPIYSQLTQRLTEAIVSGIYAPGEKLPSVRELAVEAGVNPNTVQRALSELERDGLVFSQRTAGRRQARSSGLLANGSHSGSGITAPKDDAHRFIKLANGLLTPTSGEILIAGKAPAAQRRPSSRTCPTETRCLAG